jgi:ABC-type uncharacterized transport system permease subunit
MLSNITITCFAASYLITLLLEASRLFFRLRVRWLVMMGFAAAGLFAHSAYLWFRVRSELEGASLTPLSSWYDWCLVGAWVLAATYVALAIRRRENTVGLFLIPLVLALIAAAQAVADFPDFGRQEALSYWSMCHGVTLLLGTVAATLGFAAGVMYLLQSYRLKHKLLSRPGFRLPSLEWLQQLNRRSLWLSTVLLALGLLAGLALNLVRQSTHAKAISWTDPVVVSSTGLFLWLALATLFESLYKPARAGRKVAYITLVSFVFLGLVLTLVLSGQHGSAPASPRHPTSRLQLESRATPAPDHRAGGAR